MASRLTAFLVAAIVTVTVVAGLIVGAQRDDGGPIDVLILNGSVYTGDGSGTLAEAVAIRGNQIVRVGSNRELKRLRGIGTTVIDAHGGSVVAGLNDAYTRFVAGALPLPQPDGAPGTAGQLERLAAALEALRRYGITSLHITGATEHDLTLIDMLRARGQLPVRVSGSLRLAPGLGAADLDRLEVIRARILHDLMLTVPGVAIVLDGSTGGPAASELRSAVELADRRGWQVTIEARVDAAVRAAIEAFEHLGRVSPTSAAVHRHRLVLGAPAGRADAARLAALPIVVSLQPQVWFGVSAAPGRANAPAAAASGPNGEPGGKPMERPRWWDDAAASSLSADRLVLGSGWPAAPLDPRMTLGRALPPLPVPLTESPQFLVPIAPLVPALPVSSEAVRRRTLAAFIDAYTRNAAYASFEEERKGAIAPGMLADLVVWTTDLFALPWDRLIDAEIAVTIFDGTVVYRRTDALTNP